jgi:hypothetical protein
MRNTNIYDSFFSLILSERDFVPMKPPCTICALCSVDWLLNIQHLLKVFNNILSVRIDQYRSTNFPLTEEHSLSLMQAPNIFAKYVGTESPELFREPCFFRAFDFGSSPPPHLAPVS